jgi:hypothetical protein
VPGDAAFDLSARSVAEIRNLNLDIKIDIDEGLTRRFNFFINQVSDFLHKSELTTSCLAMLQVIIHISADTLDMPTSSSITASEPFTPDTVGPDWTERIQHLSYSIVEIMASSTSKTVCLVLCTTGSKCFHKT